MTQSVWRIGQFLNSVQSTFVGLLRVWSIPIVLSLSIASGYTTYYGMSYFITGWIALIITVAVQSIVVVCTLELASIHWRANLPRFLAIAFSLVVAVVVSVSFSYFKFYEFSQRDNVLLAHQKALQTGLDSYLEQLARLKTDVIAPQKARMEAAKREANEAYVGAHPAMQGEYRNKIGRGRFWSHYNEVQQEERAQLEALESKVLGLEQPIADLRTAMREFSFRMTDQQAYQELNRAFQRVQSAAEDLASGQGLTPVKAPELASFTELTRGITPTFDMWKDISWFALACAAMVDFFTLILSYRLESTAPGPLTAEEERLAYDGLRQFGDFTINHNDELEFSFEKTELERARRVSDWSRMFTVAFLINRGYLRKVSSRSVEFAPNLYPVIAEYLAEGDAGNDDLTARRNDALRAQMERKRYG